MDGEKITGTHSCTKIGMSVAGPDNCNGSNRDVTGIPGPHRLGVTRQLLGENDSKTQSRQEPKEPRTEGPAMFCPASRLVCS